MHRWQILAVAFSGFVSLGSVGCGGDSGTKTTPADKFLGRWQNDESSTTSTFTASCQAAGAIPNFIIWSELDLQRGTLTDVSEVSTTCFQPGLSFNVTGSGTALTLVNPDPYLTAQAAADAQPSCVANIGSDGAGGTFFFVLTADTASFTLLQAASGQPPKGLFAVSGSADVVDVDSTGAASLADTCTYTSGTGDQFHQMTRP